MVLHKEPFILKFSKLYFILFQKSEKKMDVVNDDVCIQACKFLMQNSLYLELLENDEI